MIPPLRIALFGASGKLGRSIAKCLIASPDFLLKAALVHPLSSSLGHYLQENLPFTTTMKEPVDVAIDASIREGLVERLSLFLEKKLPAVIATTALTPLDWKAIQEASSHIPLFVASNFSIGMALLREMVETISLHFPSESIAIEETHHITKRDAPSGSALDLASALGAQQEKLAPIVSKREEKGIGLHHLTFSSSFERISLSHEALSREAFAQGALVAAQFLFSQNPKVYTMKDLIQNEKNTRRPFPHRS